MAVAINDNDAPHRFASLVYKLFSLFLVAVVQQNTGAGLCVQLFAIVAGAGVNVLLISGFGFGTIKRDVPEFQMTDD